MSEALAPPPAPVLGVDQDRIERLLGEPVAAMAPAGIGANSRILRVDTPTRRLALKLYPERQGDTRDRLAVEWRALTFLRGIGLASVPEPVAHDRASRLMAMEWIEGTAVGAHGEGDLDAATAFLAHVFSASSAPGADAFPTASEACLSAAEILRQIDARLEALSFDPRLDAFLDSTFRPRLAAARAALGGEAVADAALPAARRRLIPADFGFHNALRDAEGGLRFFDFDYFGWDDPVKLAADFILHPAMTLSETERGLVASRLAAAVPDDAGFVERLARHRPLYALRWALILLNLLRRDRAGEVPGEAAERRARIEGQIAKAERACALADG